MIKKFIYTILVLISLVIIVSCSKSGETASNPDDYYLGICIHSLDNEFWAQEAKGAELFASKVSNLQSRILTSDSDDNKLLQGIRDFIAEHGEKAIFVVDPSSAAVTANVAEICEEAGCYVTILTHRAEGLYPKDFSKFVIHMTENDLNSGYITAKALFDSIGGKGTVCELYGQLGNDAATARHAGFEKALKEYPNIKVLDMQVASWSQEEALKITETWLAKYGNDGINAIFCANDTMAIGAIEALKQAGLNGKIKVNGTDGIKAAYDAIKDGDMVCTIANDGYLLMGYGAAYAYYAAIGKINVNDMTPEERMVYTKTSFIDASNVDEMYEKFITGTPDYDYSNLEFAIDGYQPQP